MSSKIEVSRELVEQLQRSADSMAWSIADDLSAALADRGGEGQPSINMCEQLVQQVLSVCPENYAGHTFGVTANDGSVIGDIIITVVKPDGKSPHDLRIEAESELAELQATIARLTAENERLARESERVNKSWHGMKHDLDRLKGGQGEPVAWFTEDHLTDKSATTYDVGVSVMWGVKGWPVTPLFASPPAQVAAIDPVLGSTPEDHIRWLLDKVVNPSDYPQSVLHDQIRDTLARLDKVKELNQ